MKDKLGTYITKLMTTILDKEQEDFVKELAMSELNRLNADINQFLQIQTKDEIQEKPCCVKKKEKQLLQEEKENG